MKVEKKENVKKERKLGHKENVFSLACFAIFDWFWFLVMGLPVLVMALSLMFVDMNGYQMDTMRWNNFANFKDVLTDEVFWKSILMTLAYLSVNIIAIFVSVITAIMLSLKYPGHKLFTAITFIPNLCSSVVVSLIWLTMFDVNYGVINDVIVQLLGEDSRVLWYTQEVPFFFMICIIGLWTATAGPIVYCNAGLTNVPRELYEACSIDGGSKWQQFRYIAIPTIRPMISYLTITGVMGGLQGYGIQLIIGGALGNSWTGAAGPNNAALTTMLYAYNEGVLYGRMPRSTVISMLLGILVFIVTLIQIQHERRRD